MIHSILNSVVSVEHRNGTFMKKMQDSPLVRAANGEDLPAVLGLYRYLGMDDGAILSLDEATRIFARMKLYPDYTLHVAVAEERIVGAFSLLVMDNLGHKGAPSGVVEDVVVHPDWRRKGIGRTMMEKAMSLCAARRCYKLSLTTNKHRPDAHAFYEALGFEVHGFSYSVTREIDGVSAGAGSESLS